MECCLPSSDRLQIANLSCSCIWADIRRLSLLHEALPTSVRSLLTCFPFAQMLDHHCKANHLHNLHVKLYAGRVWAHKLQACNARIIIRFGLRLHCERMNHLQIKKVKTAPLSSDLNALQRPGTESRYFFVFLCSDCSPQGSPAARSLDGNLMSYGSSIASDFDIDEGQDDKVRMHDLTHDTKPWIEMQCYAEWFPMQKEDPWPDAAEQVPWSYRPCSQHQQAVSP